MRAIATSSVFLAVVIFLPAADAAGQTIATYNLTVENFWSQANHEAWADPFSSLTNPHFSHLGGGTHNGNLTVWQPGGFSSPGMIRMQESGWIDDPNAANPDLAAEFAEHIASGDAFSFLNYPQFFTPAGPVTVSFDVSETHPLVTLVSMLGPSPDWFVGVSGLSLLDETGNWRDTVEVDLFPYDGGSRSSDEEFVLFGPQQDPQRPITLLTDTPDVTDPDRTALNSMQIGKFTFELGSVAIPEPGSLVLCSLAAVGMLVGGWWRQKGKRRQFSPASPLDAVQPPAISRSPARPQALLTEERFFADR